MLVAASARSDNAPPRGVPASPRPEYRRGLDLPLLAAGTAFVVAGVLDSPDRKLVPVTGLDPGSIRFGFDREIVGNRDVQANSASNIVRNAALASPFVLSFAFAPKGERWRAPIDRGLLFIESMALADGITTMAKNFGSRPRPYTYMPLADRPAHPRYDVGENRAFESMPSGHATTAWCAASFAAVDHVLTRPDAPWMQHAAVGFTTAALATATSILRVDAGQHFPSDVVVGACIGVAGGVAVPLMHRYVAGGARAPAPARSSWVAAAGGMAAGTGVALLFGAVVGP